MNEFLQRLKERKLVQWTLAYIAAAFALLQGIDIVAQRFGWPEETMRFVIIALSVGLFVTLVLAWYHGERGAQRVTGTELLILALLLALGGGFLWRFAGGSHERIVSSAPAVPAPAPAKIPEKSIAVLPFVNMSGEANNDYFSDGITEEILNALAQIPNLKVAARTSAFAFKGKGEDLRKVGDVLGVATVLEGSVQRAGDNVRITAQLIDTHSGYHLWSEKYDRKLTNIFAVEDEISKTIADKLQMQLGGDQPLVAANTRNTQAHDLYLRGLSLMAARGPGLRDAVAAFKQAVAIDPGYGQAWAGLSLAYELLPYYKDADRVALGEWLSSINQAEAAAQRALALAPQSAESHLAMANILRDHLKFPDADREYAQALALNPGLAETYDQYAEMLGAVGKFNDAIARARTAASLNPVSAHPHFVLGWLLACARQPDEAVAELRKALDIWPEFALARFPLAAVYIAQGKYEEASTQASMGAQETGEDPALVKALVAAVADPAKRERAVQQLDQGGVAGRYLLYDLANAYWYSLLGAHDKAISSLQNWASIGGGPDWVTLPSLSLAAFDAIRGDPRFKLAISRKTGAPPAVQIGTAPK